MVGTQELNEARTLSPQTITPLFVQWSLKNLKYIKKRYTFGASMFNNA